MHIVLIKGYDWKKVISITLKMTFCLVDFFTDILIFLSVCCLFRFCALSWFFFLNFNVRVHFDLLLRRGNLNALG